MTDQPETERAPDWGWAVSEVMSQARRAAGQASVLAERLAQVGLHGERGAPYSESAISNWITGRTMPPADVLLAAALIADLSLDDFKYDLSVHDGVAPPYVQHRRPSDLAHQVEQLRQQVAVLQTQLMDLYARTGQRYPAEPSPGDTGASTPRRASG